MHVKLASFALVSLGLVSSVCETQAVPLPRAKEHGKRNLMADGYDAPREGIQGIQTSKSTSSAFSASTQSRATGGPSLTDTSHATLTTLHVPHKGAHSHGTHPHHGTLSPTAPTPTPSAPSASATASASAPATPSYQSRKGTLNLVSPLDDLGVAMDLGPLTLVKSVARGNPLGDWVLGFGLVSEGQEAEVKLVPLSQRQANTSSIRTESSTSTVSDPASSASRRWAKPSDKQRVQYVQVQLDAPDAQQDQELCASYKPFSWPWSKWFDPQPTTLFSFEMRPCLTGTNKTDALGYSQAFAYSTESHLVHPSYRAPRALTQSSEEMASGSDEDDVSTAIMVFTPSNSTTSSSASDGSSTSSTPLSSMAPSASSTLNSTESVPTGTPSPSSTQVSSLAVPSSSVQSETPHMSIETGLAPSATPIYVLPGKRGHDATPSKRSEFEEDEECEDSDDSGSKDSSDGSDSGEDCDDSDDSGSADGSDDGSDSSEDCDDSSDDGSSSHDGSDDGSSSQDDDSECDDDSSSSDDGDKHAAGSGTGSSSGSGTGSSAGSSSGSAGSSDSDDSGWKFSLTGSDPLGDE